MGRRIAADGSISDGASAPENADCGPAWYSAVPMLGFFVGGVQGFFIGAAISVFLYFRGCPTAGAAVASADRQPGAANVHGMADLPQPAPARGG